jgi:hypothetical protein
MVLNTVINMKSLILSGDICANTSELLTPSTMFSIYFLFDIMLTSFSLNRLVTDVYFTIHQILHHFFSTHCIPLSILPTYFRIIFKITLVVVFHLLSQ